MIHIADNAGYPEEGDDLIFHFYINLWYQLECKEVCQSIIMHAIKYANFWSCTSPSCSHLGDFPGLVIPFISTMQRSCLSEKWESPIYLSTVQHEREICLMCWLDWVRSKVMNCCIHQVCSALLWVRGLLGLNHFLWALPYFLKVLYVFLMRCYFSFLCIHVYHFPSCSTQFPFFADVCGKQLLRENHACCICYNL